MPDRVEPQPSSKQRANWFVALPVPSGPWFETLQPPEGVRLFGSQDLHVTVAFLGPVTETSARAAFEKARDFPLGITDVQLGQVQALGSKRRPSAFSALLSLGRDTVERAIAAVRTAMWEAASARQDTRPALAHVTLARPSRRASNAMIKHAARWATTLDLGSPACRLDRIALYTWSDDRQVALFRIVDELPLSEVAPCSPTGR